MNRIATARTPDTADGSFEGLPVTPVWTSNPVVEWLILEGWRIQDISELVRQVSERLVAAGIPLWRLFCLVPTLHPRYVGSGYRWTRTEPEMFRGFGEHGVQQSPAFMRNPLRLVMTDGYDAVRRRLDDSYQAGEFPLLDELKEQGATDYVCLPAEFTSGQRTAVSFACDDPAGFSTSDLQQFSNLLPVLARLIERETLRSTAVNLLDTYVGPDAGARILAGQVTRGMSQTVYAAIWYCDLRDFTGLSERLEPEALLSMLNGYFEAMSTAVEAHEGQVLKFIGDGLLAIFPVDNECSAGIACSRALDAAADGVAAMAALNELRVAEGEPPLDYGIALHLGEVMYGNIGGTNRLDFTVIGRAVNVASRMEDLCKRFRRRPLLSGELARHCGRDMEHLGRFDLRGVAEPQDVYALLP